MTNQAKLKIFFSNLNIISLLYIVVFMTVQVIGMYLGYIPIYYFTLFNHFFITIFRFAFTYHVMYVSYFLVYEYFKEPKILCNILYFMIVTIDIWVFFEYYATDMRFLIVD